MGISLVTSAFGFGVTRNTTPPIVWVVVTEGRSIPDPFDETGIARASTVAGVPDTSPGMPQRLGTAITLLVSKAVSRRVDRLAVT